MRIKNVLVFALVISLLYACTKSSNNCATVIGSPSTAEISSLQNYLANKGITATADSRGFFYEMLNPGTGTASPTAASSVTIKYKGWLTNDQVFDSTKAGLTATFPLANLILGWQLGMPLMKKDGVMNLYLPPSLGYGCESRGSIPGNSITIFRIELVNF